MTNPYSPRQYEVSHREAVARGPQQLPQGTPFGKGKMELKGMIPAEWQESLVWVSSYRMFCVRREAFSRVDSPFSQNRSTGPGCTGRWESGRRSGLGASQAGPEWHLTRAGTAPDPLSPSRWRSPGGMGSDGSPRLSHLRPAYLGDY